MLTAQRKIKSETFLLYKNECNSKTHAEVLTHSTTLHVCALSAFVSSRFVVFFSSSQREGDADTGREDGDDLGSADCGGPAALVH